MTEVVITRAQLAAMNADHEKTWRWTADTVDLMPGPWLRADGTPLGEGDAELPTDVMWTGHVGITVDDQDLAGAVAEVPRGLVVAALRLAERDNGEGGVTVDRVALRAALRETPAVKTKLDQRKAAREVTT